MEPATFLNGSKLALFHLDFMNLYMCFDEPKKHCTDNIVPRGTATASACSSFVNGFNSLMMHLMMVVDPSKAWASSAYISATDSSSLAGGGWASSWISTSRARAGRVFCRGEGHWDAK